MSDIATSLTERWSHTTSEIGPRGLERQREASAEERAELARALDILGIDKLVVDYRIEARPGGRYRLTGELDAVVVQACVVTLDPVSSEITDHIDVEFLPAADIGAGSPTVEAETGILDAEEQEPLDHDRIPLGRIVAETLLAALPSHPRAHDAALDVSEAGPVEPGPTSPFAALAGWKPRKE